MQRILVLVAVFTHASALRLLGAKPKKPRLNGPTASAKDAAAASNSSLPNVCFIHVGKAGGGSIVNGLWDLARENVIQNVVEVHQYPASHDRHFLGEKDGLKHYTHKVGGPAIYSDTVKRGSREECLAASNVVLWVRDPIARVVSCWKCCSEAKRDKDGKSVNDGIIKRLGGDLDYVLTKLSAQGQRGHKTWAKIMGNIAHATIAAPYYLNTCEHLDQLPIKFVGRTESMKSDWSDLTAMFAGMSGMEPPSNATLGHRHVHDAKKLTLSPTSIQFLMEHESIKQEFTCLQRLHELGWLDKEYMASVMRNTDDYRSKMAEGEVFLQMSDDEYDSGDADAAYGVSGPFDSDDLY